MPTEQGSPVPRRKLGIFAAAAGIVALLVVVTGIRAREDSGARLREWTDNQAIPTVAVVLPDARALAATLDLPGRDRKSTRLNSSHSLTSRMPSSA